MAENHANQTKAIKSKIDWAMVKRSYPKRCGGFWAMFKRLTRGTGKIRHEVEPFVKDAAALAIWSKEFFLDFASRIKVV